MLFNTTSKMLPKKRIINFIKGLIYYPCPNCGAKERHIHLVRIQNNNNSYCGYCKKIIPVSDLY
jgi:predicted RNA-binding Zn-ribbon protein involved in translation (DUF1610 family)